jgi:membrane fusion protein, heavy metal efflux system
MKPSAHDPSTASSDAALDQRAPSGEDQPTPVSALRRIAAPALIFCTLGALAFWGHYSGWSLTALAALRGQEKSPEIEWCDAHNVLEAECIECNPKLLPRTKTHGWCKQHGVHDCPLCNPDVVQLAAKPQFVDADRQRASRALAIGERPRNNSKCQLYLRRIQFSSADAVEKAGIKVEPVWRTSIVESVSANGQLGYDQTRSAHLSSRRAGTVWRVEKQLGDRVVKGEVLALVDAAEVGRAKSDFLQAWVQADLKRQNYGYLEEAAGALPARQLREGASAMREAQIRLLTAQQALVNLGLPLEIEEVEEMKTEELVRRLHFLGLPDELVKSLDPKTTTANLIPITSPLDGVVVTRDVVAGEVVDGAKVLFAVADVDRLWLTLDVRLEDAERVELGQQVRFRPDGSEQQTEGAISWISTEVDEKTRTVKVRAELANAQHRWKAFTFGIGEIVLREEENAIAVPNDAVQFEGDCYVVFVRDKDFLKKDAPKLFHVRNVRIGAKNDRYTEIIAGVAPAELVATAGSKTLSAELLKNNLGEGCACHH